MSHKKSPLIAKLEDLSAKSLSKHQSLIKFIESIDYETLNGTSKVAIEISSQEEIATRISELSSLEIEKTKVLSSLDLVSSKILNIFDSFKGIKENFNDIRNKTNQTLIDIKADIKKIKSVLNEYKERCRNTLLFYLRSLDHDLRRILKPLVPSSVLNDQIKHQPINKNSSLYSSAESLQGSGRVEKTDSPLPIKESTKEPIVKDETKQKATNHLDLLITTLEKVAKDLINILVEANNQYHDIAYSKDAYSHPPTPLAAPLPEYFVYETEESDLPATNKIIIKEDAHTWIKRFNELHKKNVISSYVYASLIDKVNPIKLKGCKIDLQDIFKNLDLPADLRENITFALVNKSSIEQRDVTLSDLLLVDEKGKKDEKKEEQKSVKSNGRQKMFLVKPQKRSFDLAPKTNEGKIFASVDFQTYDMDIQRQSPIPKYRLASVKSKGPRKSINTDKIEKGIRVRSVTPVFSLKDKAGKLSNAKKFLKKH